MNQQIIEKILSNEATPAEKRQFEKWLDESADHQEYFNKTKVVWDKLDDAFSTKTFDKNRARFKVDAEINSGNNKLLRLRRIKRMSWAASFLVLLGLSFFILHKVIQRNQFSTLYVAGDSIREVSLQDGSHVWLNKHSTLKLPENFSRKDRTVALKGEAYFEVKRNEAKPFKVMAGKTVTRVLGTSFNVELDTLSGDVNLYVKSGKVAFYKRHKIRNKYTLTVGAYARYSENDSRILIGNNESLNYLAWKTGRLTFYDTPIAQVCEDLSKYYGVRINAELNDETILTGTFEHEKLEDVLAIIKLSLGVEIREEDGAYSIEK